MGLFKDFGVTNITLKRKIIRLQNKQFKSEKNQPIIMLELIQTEEIRGKIFYCTPIQSSQKPHLENNHNFIREILANGQSWNHLTQEKIDLMFSHINSTPRENLGGKTPYEIFAFIYGEEFTHKLNIQKIAKDEVTMY